MVRSVRSHRLRTAGGSKMGIPILCPEVVLLYKAKLNKEKDVLDLQAVLPKLNREQISWLSESIADTHGEHGWLSTMDKHN